MARVDLSSKSEVKKHLASTRVHPRSKSRHMPGWMYTSPEVFQRETERIFLKEWLVIGRVEEIPNPGDYFTFDIVDELPKFKPTTPTVTWST